jgi:hypothetical protein
VWNTLPIFKKYQDCQRTRIKIAFFYC